MQSLNSSKSNLLACNGIIIIRMAHCRIFWHKEIITSMIWRCVLLDIGKSDKLRINMLIRQNCKINANSLRLSLTDCVARICNWGSVDSSSFCTIFKKLSTNRFRVCAWQATRSWSIASIAITTKPFRLLSGHGVLLGRIVFVMHLKI